MSSFKFKEGEPRKVTLAFDSPKQGTNDYGAWYLYGIKTDINDDEDSFFATATLHSMIQTLGAKEGDEVTIEKCVDGDTPYFKVNGLSITDMNSGGAFEKIEAAKPNPLKVTLEGDLDISIEKLAADFEKLKSEFARLEDLYKQLESKMTSEVNDIPF